MKTHKTSKAIEDLQTVCTARLKYINELEADKEKLERRLAIVDRRWKGSLVQYRADIQEGKVISQKIDRSLVGHRLGPIMLAIGVSVANLIRLRKGNVRSDFEDIMNALSLIVADALGLT